MEWADNLDIRTLALNRVGYLGSWVGSGVCSTPCNYAQSTLAMQKSLHWGLNPGPLVFHAREHTRPVLYHWAIEADTYLLKIYTYIYILQIYILQGNSDKALHWRIVVKIPYCALTVHFQCHDHFFVYCQKLSWSLQSCLLWDERYDICIYLCDIIIMTTI